MKECKIIHINDGSHRTLTNGNFHYAEDFPWAEKMLETYLNAGYQIAQMISDYTPAPRGGGLSFYKGGFTVVLIRESREYDEFFGREDWKRLNTDMGYEEDIPRDGEDDDDDDENEDDESGDGKNAPCLEDVLADCGVDSEEELDALRRAADDDMFKKYEDEEGGLPFN